VNLQDIITISFSGITDRKFRFALNLLGILIGCAAVTGLISVTQGMNTEISSQLDILGANSLTIIPLFNVIMALTRLLETHVSRLLWAWAIIYLISTPVSR